MTATKAAYAVLCNDFHNAQYATRKTWDEIDALRNAANDGDAEARRYLRRVKRHLCPAQDECLCSDDTGHRCDARSYSEITGLDLPARQR